MPMGPMQSILSRRPRARTLLSQLGITGLALMAVLGAVSTTPVFADDPATREREAAFSFGAPKAGVAARDAMHAISTSWFFIGFVNYSFHPQDVKPSSTFLPMTRPLSWAMCACLR